MEIIAGPMDGTFPIPIPAQVAFDPRKGTNVKQLKTTLWEEATTTRIKFDKLGEQLKMNT
jgi:hypothetical protein